MSGWGVEFEFVEDDAGNGQFVSAGGGVPRLLGLVRQNQLEQAARAYEEMGRSAAGALIEEARISSMNTRRNIAEIFKRARDFDGAAQVLEQLSAHGEAAVLFEQGGDFASAARCHQAAGEFGKAAQALERAGQLDAAVKLYQKAGDNEGVAGCLVRLERFYEAAALYRQLGNVKAEVELLRLVPASDPRHLESVERLATLMERHGHLQQAAQLIVGSLRANEAARKHPGLQVLLLRCLEALGKHEEARRVRASFGMPVDAPLPVADPPTAPSMQRPDLQDHAAEDYGFLKAIPIFGELALADMRDLFRAAQQMEFAAGAALIEQGQPSRGLLVITDGKVDVSAMSGGSNRLLNTLSAGAYVGEIGLVQDAPASARVVAQTPVRALFISKDAFAHYLYEHPAAALAIYKLFTQNLAQRVRALSEQAA